MVENEADISDINVTRLLPLAAGLWLVYLLALLVIDQVLYPQPVFPPLYYLINGIDALVVLGLGVWRRGRNRLGHAFLPLVIGLMSVAPVVSGNLMVLGQPALGPAPAPNAEVVALRLMPMLFMALVLTAWQYRWRYVLAYSIGIALFTMALHVRFFRSGGASILPPVTVLVIQMVSFLVVGYFISTLMTRLKRQQEALARANAQLVLYTGTLEELTISRERNRLARELHDTLAHTLSALSVQLETVKAYWDIEPALARDMLDRSLAATRSGLQETRRALKALRASPLDDLGLTLALQRMVEETAARANLKLDLSLPNHPLLLSAEIEQAIYRVAQEALANAAYHANANKLALSLAIDDSTVMLKVSDDGLGFNPEQGEMAGHFGLSGMMERAQLVGGQLSIDSRPGLGTTIQFVVKDRRDESSHLR